MKPRIDYEARFYQALKRISVYSSPEWFDRHSERQYGLSPEESVRMAYENVIGEAKAALAGYRRKKPSSTKDVICGSPTETKVESVDV